MDGLLSIIVVLGMVAIAIWIYFVLPAQMAEERGRSALGWVLIGLVFSPFASIIGLLVLGDTFERYEQRKTEQGRK